MVGRPPLPSFFIIRDRRRRHRAAQAVPTTVYQPPPSSKQPPQQQAQPQRPAFSTTKKKTMGASMSSQATTVSLRPAAGGSKSKSRKGGGGGSSSASSASAPSSSAIAAANNSSDPDLAGVSPTDGKIQPVSKDPPSDDFAGRPSPTATSTTGSDAASPLSKRQKASAAALLLAASTPGLANEAEEVDGFEKDSAEDGFFETDSKFAEDAAGGNPEGGSSVLAAASECCARLLFSGAGSSSPSLSSGGGNLGVGSPKSLKVASAAEADDDGRDDIDNDIDDIVNDGEDGDIATDDEEEGRDDIEDANDPNISGSSSASILQTLLGGSGSAPKASPSGNTAAPTTTTAGSTSMANGGGKKSLGHIGDGRRLAKKTTGGTSPTAEEIEKARDRARSEAPNRASEMPIQMMTSRRTVTPTSSYSASASVSASVTAASANAKPPKRLSREVRGLLASAGGDCTGIGGGGENAHPNTANNKKKGGNGANTKPLTRSKAKQQKQKMAKKTTVPPHLLQEHPSVRNSNKAVGPTATTTKSSSSKPSSKSKSGGLGLASALNLRNRAAQQAASPTTAIIPSTTTTTHVATPDHPRTLTLHGCRVTMIDDATKVFVIDAVTPAQCDAIRTMTDDYVRETARTDPDKQTWRTLYTYTKMDLPCGEVPGLMDGIVDGIMSTVVDIVGSVYGNARAASKLRPRSWKEPHLLHYQVLPDKPEHLGIEMHYDGCDVTWSLMLSDSADYDGGGTYIRCLRRTIMLRQGQILIHPGELYHKGNHITAGTRSMMVCFTDGFDPQIIDASRASDDKEEFTKNVFLA